MSATNALENALLSLLFENANTGLNIGDATGLRGSTTAGNLQISLHTGDPSEAGGQTTSESAYTNYARVAVTRSAAGWTVASGVADNDSAITFPQCGATGSSVTNFGIGSDSSGAGNLLLKGTSALAVSQNVTPQFAAGTLDTSLD